MLKTLSGALFFAAFLPSILWGNEAQENVYNNRILARVADRSISSQDVVIEFFLHNPPRFRVPPEKVLSEREKQQHFQELVIQALVEEENRIIGTQDVSSSHIDRELARIRSEFGNRRWQDFTRYFDLGEQDLRQRLRRIILVEQTLETRLQDAMTSPLLRGGQDQEVSEQRLLEKAEEALQAWLQQLRSRYRVQVFEYDSE